MATTQNLYSQTRVDQIHRLLERHHQAGEAREYDILVDNIPVVPRTSNLNLFNAYEDEIQPDTKAITIRIYQGSSHNCDRYIFNLRGGANGLEGVEGDGLNGGLSSGLNGIIQKEINTKKLEWDHDKLKEEHDALKKEHHGLKSQFGKLESEYNALQAQYSKMGMLGAVAGPFVDNLIGNSKLLKKTPLGQLLKPAEEIEAQGGGSGGDASFSPCCWPCWLLSILRMASSGWIRSLPATIEGTSTSPRVLPKSVTAPACATKNTKDYSTW